MTQILGCRVHWHGTYGNAPSLMVEVDTPWAEIQERMLYESYILGQAVSLSAEQEQAVGRGSFPGRGRTEVLLAEDPVTGFVRWVQVGSDKDYPRGAGDGIYKMKDGTERKLVSGWYGSPFSINSSGHDLPQIVDVSVKTPQYDNVALAACLRFDVVEDLVRRCLPHVEIVEFTYGYTYKLAGRPSKDEWLSMTGKAAEEVRNRLKEKYGREWYKLSTEEERAELTQMPYETLANEERIVSEGDPWRLVCRNCRKEMFPSERERKMTKYGRKKAIRVWQSRAKHYHCCVPNA